MRRGRVANGCETRVATNDILRIRMGEMKNGANKSSLVAIAVILSMVTGGVLFLPQTSAEASAATAPSTDIYARAVPDIDSSLTAQVTRAATSQQLAAADNFKAAFG